ncbi:immunoglobulin domain-containing protein [Massilia sp. W12]|uniref:immunoglobulin domain-containing protein n=1 Tax=Massilia sp. W12 TaxID=3126507 RepID=UPI0030D603BC
MKSQATLALALAAILTQGCGGQADPTTSAPRLLAHGSQSSQAGKVPATHSGVSQLRALAGINPDDIDKGTFCYAETHNRTADISDIKNNFNANNWLQTITAMYGRRWPSGQALAQAQANDQYFKQFVDTSSFNKLAESMMVAIHEETHMWDLAAGRTEWNNYTSSWIDSTYQFMKMPLHDGFARKEILPLIKDDASASTDGVYLKDAQQGEYHLQGVTAELNASLMGLPAALMVAEYIDGVGASNSRDLALTNMSYLQLYLRIAKQNYPAFWQKIKAEPQLRKYVLVQFLRMSYFVKMSESYAAKLGSANVPRLIERVYAPENLAILEEFSGYKFPTRLDDHCMGGAGGGDTPTAPAITSQPQNQTVTVGQPVSFAVVAKGSDLRYQWRKNGAPLAGAASPTYTIAAAALADAGTYSVLVSNTLGSVASSDALLTVNAQSSVNLLQNGGFENGVTPWQGTTAAIGDFTSYGYQAHLGTKLAWLGGHGASATETLYQQISIPATAGSAQLRFYMRVATAESGSTARDKLSLQVLSSSGAVLGTLASYSNLQASSAYKLYTLDMSAYKGKTVRVHFKMVEDAQRQTSFLLDEMSLIAQ